MNDPKEKLASPQVSVVIPAFNEQDWIKLTIESLAAFLTKEFETWEIIVVDDGSTDRTQLICEEFIHTIENFFYLRNPKNSGKGFSVRRGMQVAHGEIRYFMDADMPFELDAFQAMQEALKTECDIAVGARDLPGSTLVDVPFSRFLAGHVFSWLVSILAVENISDTQCGLKGFRSVAAEEIFSRATINDFGMDVEVLFIAQHLGYRIKRIPVRMTGFRGDSRVHLVKDSINMFLELILIRWNACRGIYHFK